MISLLRTFRSAAPSCSLNWSIPREGEGNDNLSILSIMDCNPQCPWMQWAILQYVAVFTGLVQHCKVYWKSQCLLTKLCEQINGMKWTLHTFIQMATILFRIQVKWFEFWVLSTVPLFNILTIKITMINSAMADVFMFGFPMFSFSSLSSKAGNEI